MGVEITSNPRASGTIYLDRLTWDGAPNVRLSRPAEGGTLWRKAWVNAVDQYEWRFPEAYRLVQNRGIGMISTGGRDWKDYSVTATIIPHLAKSTGLCARVQGLERYYSLEIGEDLQARLVKALDGRKVLAQKDFSFEWDDVIELKLTVKGAEIQASINGQKMFSLLDEQNPLLEGGVALLVEEGRISCDAVEVHA